MRGLRRLSATRAQWEQVAKMGAKDSVKKKKKPKGGRK